jgi:hypothetical protein
MMPDQQQQQKKKSNQQQNGPANFSIKTKLRVNATNAISFFANDEETNPKFDTTTAQRVGGFCLPIRRTLLWFP